MSPWRGVRHAACLIVVLAGMPLTTGAQSRAPRAPLAPAASPRLYESRKRLGPFRIDGRSFDVVLSVRRIGPPSTTPFHENETVTRFVIRDSAGRAVQQADFPAAREGGFFAPSLDVSARPLLGRRGSGLLLNVVEVSAQATVDRGEWRLFGLANGRLVRFDKPIAVDGGLTEDKGPTGAPARTVDDPDLGELLHFQVWTRRGYAVVPVRVLWSAARLEQAWPRAARIHQFAVGAHLQQRDQDAAVRLHPYPGAKLGMQAVVVRKDARVAVLGGAGRVRWDEGPRIVKLSVADLWLKLRIDGQEGWIHTDEDFDAAGVADIED